MFFMNAIKEHDDQKKPCSCADCIISISKYRLRKGKPNKEILGALDPKKVVGIYFVNFREGMVKK